MRRIDFIVLHCTAGPQNQTIAEILAYWKKEHGWTKPGYHHIIAANGRVHDLLTIKTPSNGVAGHNAHSIHISTLGGIGSRGEVLDNRTPAQKTALIKLITMYNRKFPNAVILGHRDFSPDKNKDGIIESSEWMKSCPSYDVHEWLREIGFKSIAQPVMMVTRTTINIREGGGTKFPIVTDPLDAGTMVKKLAEANGWTYVEVSETKILGWIKSTFLMIK